MKNKKETSGGTRHGSGAKSKYNKKNYRRCLQVSNFKSRKVKRNSKA